MKKHLTYQDAKSNKFWHIEQSGQEFTVTYGRTDTTGSSKTKTFSNEAEALKEAEKLIAQKIKKGYEEGTDSPKTPDNKEELAKKEPEITSEPESKPQPTDGTLNLEVERKIGGGMQSIALPRNKAEVITLVYNYKNFFAKKYSENEFYQILSDGLSQIPKHIFFEINAEKKKEYKNLAQLHWKQHADRYQEPFTTANIKNGAVFYVDKKVDNGSYIANQLKKNGATITAKLTDKTTHAFITPGIIYKDDITYLDANSANDYFKGSNPTKPSPYSTVQNDKLMELLTSNNTDSIDLGLTMLQQVETIDKDIFVAMLFGYCTKIGSSSFKKGVKDFVKETVEHYIKNDPKSEVNYVNILLKGEDPSDIIGILADHDINPDLFIQEHHIKEIDVESVVAEMKNKGTNARYIDMFIESENKNKNTTFIGSPKSLFYLSNYPAIIQKTKEIYFTNEIYGRRHFKAVVPFVKGFTNVTKVSVHYPKKSGSYDGTIRYELAKAGDITTLKKATLALFGKKTVYDILWDCTEDLRNYPTLEEIRIEMDPMHFIKLKDKFTEHLNDTLKTLPNLKKLELYEIQSQYDLGVLLDGTSIELLKVDNYSPLKCKKDFSHQLKQITSVSGWKFTDHKKITLTGNESIKELNAKLETLS